MHDLGMMYINFLSHLLPTPFNMEHLFTMKYWPTVHINSTVVRKTIVQSTIYS